jgi:hypothetical protein
MTDLGHLQSFSTVLILADERELSACQAAVGRLGFAMEESTDAGQADAVIKAASARHVLQPVFCRMGTTAAGFAGLLQ